jgi:hypothetical protein
MIHRSEYVKLYEQVAILKREAEYWEGHYKKLYEDYERLNKSYLNLKESMID